MPHRRQRDPLTWLVVGATTLVWTSMAFYAMVTGRFAPFEIATGPYLVVVGAITGVKIFRNGPNGKPK